MRKDYHLTSAILDHGAISGHSFTMSMEGLYFQSFSIKLQLADKMHAFHS